MSTGTPNVIFVSLEDSNPWFGCYGHTQVKTPNIDAIASEGTVFRRAFCQAPVCNPSRASMITGLRPDTTGVYGNFDEWRDKIPESTKTIPEHLCAAGYHTVNIGKVVHGWAGYTHPSAGGEERVRAMWETHLDNPAGKTPIKEPQRPTYELREQDKQWPGAEFLQKSMNWGSTGLSAEDHADAMRARAAAAAIKDHVVGNAGRPLFLSIGLISTHYAFRPPEEFAAMYPPERILLRNYPADDLDDVPVTYPPFNNGDEHRLTAEDKRSLIAAYFACISFVDYCIGILADALKEAGMWEDTVFCISSDHGLHFGEHGLWRKETLFEESAHVPLIVRAPGKPAGVSDALVELVDWYPTLCRLCGVESPQGLEGTSLVPVMEEPSRSWKKAIFTQVRRGSKNVTVRTDAWRYSEWGGPKYRELYDLRNDPREIHNRAYDAAYADQVAEMQRVLAGGWRGALPEGVDPIE